MKKHLPIILLFFVSGFLGVAQTLTCPSPYVYVHGGASLTAYDPGAPFSASNPTTLNIPTFGGGLTLMPNINGGTVSPTFYTTSGGTYWYWDGANWVNTGHSTGNAGAVNIGGCNGVIYNLVGNTGDIYSYDGTGNGTLLTTLSNFNGGGPYDIVTDCNCNFYALNTTAPNQTLTMYNSLGQPQCTYTMSGMPNTSAGGGFAIIGNNIYVRNAMGYYAGTISGLSIAFTAVNGFTASAGDFASCSVCYGSSAALSGVTISNGGTLSCGTPTMQLSVTTTVNPVTYNWNGPGIVGATTGSVVVANLQGVYTCTVYGGSCPPAQAILTTTVYSNKLPVQATLTPAGNVCIPANGNTQLVLTHGSIDQVVTWTGSTITPVVGTDFLTASSAGSYTATVTNTLNGCSATRTINIGMTPAVSFALSSTTVCSQAHNGSPASITLTPSGASNYTLLTSNNYSTSAPTGTLMPLFPLTNLNSTNTIASGTLIGQTGLCADTAFSSFLIVLNPSLSVSSPTGNICPGKTWSIAVSGANSYTWMGGPGLNVYTGPNVEASPAVSSVYTVMGDYGGCKSLVRTVSITVLPLPTFSISAPNPTICAGSSVVLSANGTATSYIWSPTTNLSSTTGATVAASPPSKEYYTVVGSLNSCTASSSATVNIVQPPVISYVVSSPTVCSHNYNGSPHSLSVTPSGASSWTLMSVDMNISFPHGPTMQLTPTGPQTNLTKVVTSTLVGVTGVCRVQKTLTVSVIPNPVVSITPPNSNLCPGKSQEFSASGADSYTWLPAQQYSLTSPSSILAYPFYTSYYAVIGSANGCQSAVKNAVAVILPVPDVSVSPISSTVCIGGTVNILAGGTADSYSWFPSIGLSTASGTNVIAQPLSTQVYTVVGGLKTCSNQAVTTVSAIQVPTISVTASDYTVCSGTKTSLHAEGADSFKWLPAEVLNNSTGPSVFASPNSLTNFTVHGYNGTCTGSTTVLINTVKPPDMKISAERNQVCIGSTIPLKATGAESYVWHPASAILFNGSDSIVSAYPKSNTNYTVIGSNHMGTVSCYQQLSYSVMVVPVIKPLVSGNARICEGDHTTLVAKGGNSYNWQPSTGLNVTNGSGVVAGPEVSTVYTVEVSHDGYCGVTQTVEVEVNKRPTVFAGNDTTFNLNQPVIISAKGTGTLTWIVGEAIACAVCPETQVYPAARTCYVVEAVNEEGCTATDDICVDVTEDFNIFIPNSFTPNNDGLNDRFMIYGENIYNVSLQIYDRWGVEIFRSNNASDSWDGTFHGEPCKIDIYTYTLSYTGLNRKHYKRSGHVSIVK